MKLYSDQSGAAPSPRRVRIFLAEKAMAVDVVKLELHTENRTAEFREKNRTTGSARSSSSVNGSSDI